MFKSQQKLQPLTFYIVISGTILAALTSVTPLANGAFKLSFGYLLMGLTPYIIYMCICALLKRPAQISTGIVLLAADLYARMGLHIIYTANADHLHAIYLCLILTLLIIPAGAALGSLIAGFMQQKT